MPESPPPGSQEPGASDPNADTRPVHQSVLKSIERKGRPAPKVLLREGEESQAPPVKPGGREVEAGRGSSERYQVLGELARGGVGVILKGHDVDLGRDVAMKVLRQEHSNNETVFDRFVEEAQIGGQLQHPGIVPVYELGMQADDRPYFTMKLIKGRTLAELLEDRAEGCTWMRRVVTIFEQICLTMAYAHSRLVIHRDLKPANVMVGAFGEVQVVDWGFAKVLRRGGIEDEKRARKAPANVSQIETVRTKPGSSGSDSVAGSVLGTPAYMPPEQARGDIDELDERADVFALGAILCEILLGRPPYTGSAEEVLIQAADAKQKEVRELLDGCDADRALVDLTLRCLNPAPATRPRNAQAVADAVTEFLHSVEERAQQAQLEAAEAQVKEVAARKAHRLTLALALTIMLSLVIGGGGYLTYQRNQRQAREMTLAKVDESLHEAQELRGRATASADLGLLKDALQVAERSRELLESGAITEADTQRVDGLIEELRRDEQRMIADQAQATADQEVLAELEEIWAVAVDQIGTGGDPMVFVEENLSRALRDYGLDVETMELDAICEQIAETGIGIELAPIFDQWASWLRTANFAPRRVMHPWEDLIAIAQAADPDEYRGELRDAIIEGDRQRIQEIAASPNLRGLPSPTLLLLTQAVNDIVGKDQGLELTRYVQSIRENDYQLCISLAFSLERVGQPIESRQAYAMALALRPQSRLARRKLISFTQNLEARRLILDEGIRRDPEYATYHFQLGFLLGQEGDVAGELAAIHEAIRLDPQHVQAHHNLAYAYLGEQRYEEAIEALQECFRLRPGPNADRQTALASALWHAGAIDEAMAEFLGVRSFDGFLFAAMIARDQGDVDQVREFSFQALDSARRSAESRPTDATLWNLAWILATSPELDDRDPDQALQAAERSMELSPEPWTALVVAVARLHLEDWTGVLQVLPRGKIEEREFPHGIVDFCTAIASYQLGDEVRARQAFEKGKQWLEQPAWTRYPYRLQAEEFYEDAKALVEQL